MRWLVACSAVAVLSVTGASPLSEFAMAQAESPVEEINHATWRSHPAWWTQELGVEAYVTTGLRFSSLSIPQGATIVKAQAYLFAGNPKEKMKVNVAFEYSPNSMPWSASAPPSDRLVLASSVMWDVTTPWQAGTWHGSPDLSVPLQELVSSPAWGPGNAVSLIITHVAGSGAWHNVSAYGTWKTYSQHRSAARGFSHSALADTRPATDDQPVLMVEYTTAQPNATGKVTTPASVVPTKAPADMSIEMNKAGLNVPALHLGYYKGHTSEVGVRTTVKIPAGATITAAMLRVVALDNTMLSDVVVGVGLEDDSDPSPYGWDEPPLINRSTIDTPVKWSLEGDWNFGASRDSPSLISQLQKLVSSPGWGSSARTVSVIVTHISGNGYRVIGAAGTPYAPEFVVDYVPPPQAPPASGIQKPLNRWRSCTGLLGEQDVAVEVNGAVVVGQAEVRVGEGVVGLAFRGLKFPAGARITKSRLHVTAGAGSGAPTLDVAVERSRSLRDWQNPRPSQRATNMPVRWTVGRNWVPGARYGSPDLAASLQSLLPLPWWQGPSGWESSPLQGWTSIDAVTILLKGSVPGVRAIESSGAGMPCLEVEYELPQDFSH